jgi:hypothetical protein
VLFIDAREGPTADEISAGFCNRTRIDPGLPDDENWKLSDLVRTISEGSDRILQAESRPTGEALPGFLAGIVEKSWTAACALLARARDADG